MTDSILQTIKQMLGLDPDCDDFNTDVIVFINDALFTLGQLGIGSKDFYSIDGDEQTWSEFLEDVKNYEAVKKYVYLKTRLGFDPPSSSFVIQSIEKQIAETEWRLMIEAEGRVQNDSG